MAALRAVAGRPLQRPLAAHHATMLRPTALASQPAPDLLATALVALQLPVSKAHLSHAAAPMQHGSTVTGPLVSHPVYCRDPSAPPEWLRCMDPSQKRAACATPLPSIALAAYRQWPCRHEQ